MFTFSKFASPPARASDKIIHFEFLPQPAPPAGLATGLTRAEALRPEITLIQRCGLIYSKLKLKESDILNSYFISYSLTTEAFVASHVGCVSGKICARAARSTLFRGQLAVNVSSVTRSTDT